LGGAFINGRNGLQIWEIWNTYMDAGNETRPYIAELATARPDAICIAGRDPSAVHSDGSSGLDGLAIRLGAPEWDVAADATVTDPASGIHPADRKFFGNA
jgi:hypothetical protein